MKRWGRAWRAVALGVGLAVLAACSAPADTDPDATATPSEAEATEQAVDRSHEYQGRVRAEATGAANFVWEGEDLVRVTRTGGPDLSVNLLSIGFLAPVILPEEPQNRFRWAFDLLTGYADQPGTFTLTGQPVNGRTDMSFLIWMRVKDGSKEAVFSQDEVEFLKSFNVIRKPCTLVVGPEERSGSLDCPEMADEQGETLAFKVSWEAVSPSEPVLE